MYQMHIHKQEDKEVILSSRS